MKNGFHRIGLYAAVFAAGASLPAIALAQSSNPTPAPQGEAPVASSGDIIVTAQKRSERLQDVPVSVSVFGTQGMEASRIDNGTEIARQTPNLRASVLGNESQPKFALRGVSTSEFNLNAISPTGVFYDEVYVGAQYLGGASTLDLDQIEVLRGPQGTLFGKNTTAGAINYISHRLDYRSEGEISVGYGSYGYAQIKASGETPLIEDRLSVRVALDIAHSGGYIKSVTPNIPDRSNIDHKTGRLTIGYKDDSGFKATFKLFHTESNARSIGVINTGIGPGGLNALGVDPRVNPYTGAPLGPHEMAPDRNGRLLVNGTLGYLTLEKDLGFATLTSITSHLVGSFLNEVDASGTNTNLLDIDFRARNKETSQDLRLTSNGNGPLKLIGGLYFFRDDIAINTRYTIFGGPPILPILTQSYDQRRTSYAAYLDGTLKLTDIFSVYGGIRYTDDKGQLTNFQVTPIITPQPTLRYHDGKPTGRLGVRMTLSPDIMLFGQYARGYRSSAFNGGALTNPADLNVAKPEKLDAFEVGLKSQWFNRRLTFNASAFLYNFTNQQFINLVGISNQQLVNAGRSRIKGVELELVAHPTDRLSFNASAGFLDGKYKKLILDGIDYAGNDLIEAPHSSISFGGDYNLPFANGDTLTIHADATHVASQYYQASNTPLSLANPFWDAGARIAYRFASGKYEIAVYGKNLTDNHEVTGIVLDATSQTRFATVPYPRRFGGELTVKF